MSTEVRTTRAGGVVTRWYDVRPASGSTHDRDTGPAVLLLHGGAHGEDAATAWGAVAQRLADATGRRVLAPDLLGFGGTDKLRDFADLPGRLVSHVADWLEAEQVRQVDAVGLSMGGSVLLRDLCGPTPRLPVRRLVLVSAGGTPIGGEVRARLADYDGTVQGMRAQVRLAFADGRFADDDAVVLPRHEASRVPGAWETVASFGLRAPWAAPPPPGDPVPYERLHLPVMVVVGGQDALKEPGWADDLLARLPDGRRLDVPDAGHCPQLEDPDAFLAGVQDFLAPGDPTPSPTPAPAGALQPSEAALMKILYTARATSTGGGRSGSARSDDGTLDLALAPPAAMGGSGDGTNPEQLFAAGYSACFHSAMQHVARDKGLDASGSAVHGEVGIGPLDDRPGFGLAVALTVDLPALERPVAQDLVEAAHQVCPYSNATRGNIDVTLAVGETA